jgi:hypothetical protein
VTEFFNEKNGYVVPHKLVPAEFMVHTHDDGRVPMTGCWSEMSTDDLIAAMRYVYENPVDVFLRGLVAAKDVECLSLEAMYKRYANLILKYA